MATLPSTFPRMSVAWRPLTDADLPGVAVLEARIHAAPWTIGNFHDALASGYPARVAICDGHIVAYGVLMLAPGEAQILNISVVPEARRMGLGRWLVVHFLDEAQQHGAEQCFLEVRVSNSAAIALYESTGFARIARRTSYYPAATEEAPREDALVMRHGLASARPALTLIPPAQP